VSIEKRQRRKGTVWVVWYRDDLGRSRNKTFDRKSDAEAFEAKVKLLKRSDELADLDAGKEPLEEFVAEWWTLYGERHLKPKTRKQYRDLLDRFVLPDLGRLPLRKITPRILETWAAELEASGVPGPTLRKTLGMLQGIFERALAWGRVKSNPVKSVKKPAAGRKRLIRALSPKEIEDLRAALPRLPDKTLISVLGYAGLRPGEALALTWGDIGEAAIAVDKALSLGELKGTKTERVRSVPMLRPLVQDLAEWRFASGRPGDGALVFPASDGRHWREDTYRNWRRRIFTPAAKAAGLGAIRPYDLRHSLASLLFAEGRNPAEIAEQLGNTIETLMSTYLHIIEDLRGQRPQKAENVIRKARQARVTQTSHKKSVLPQAVEEKTP
jgi:integrase